MKSVFVLLIACAAAAQDEKDWKLQTYLASSTNMAASLSEMCNYNFSSQEISSVERYGCFINVKATEAGHKFLKEAFGEYEKAARLNLVVNVKAYQLSQTAVTDPSGKPLSEKKLLELAGKSDPIYTCSGKRDSIPSEAMTLLNGSKVSYIGNVEAVSVGFEAEIGTVMGSLLKGLQAKISWIPLKDKCAVKYDVALQVPISTEEEKVRLGPQDEKKKPMTYTIQLPKFVTYRLAGTRAVENEKDSILGVISHQEVDETYVFVLNVSWTSYETKKIRVSPETLLCFTRPQNDMLERLASVREEQIERAIEFNENVIAFHEESPEYCEVKVTTGSDEEVTKEIESMRENEKQISTLLVPEVHATTISFVREKGKNTYQDIVLYGMGGFDCYASAFVSENYIKDYGVAGGSQIAYRCPNVSRAVTGTEAWFTHDSTDLTLVLSRLTRRNFADGLPLSTLDESTVNASVPLTGVTKSIRQNTYDPVIEDKLTVEIKGFLER